MAEETSHLAPHGVPSNPIPRALSSNRLHDLANQDYGSTYQTGDGSLGIPGQSAPGGVNPFRQDGGGNLGGGGYNYSKNPFVQNDGEPERSSESAIIKEAEPINITDKVKQQQFIISPGRDVAFAW